MTKNINIQKYHPELEENTETQKPLPSATELLHRINKISVEYLESDISTLLDGVKDKLSKLIQNNIQAPTALVSMIETLEKNQKPSNITLSTIARIIS